jgi:acyl-CoA oxidase
MQNNNNPPRNSKEWHKKLFAVRDHPNEVRKLASVPADFDMELMKLWIDHDCHQARKDLREFLKDDLFIGKYHQTLEEMRSLATARLKKICEQPGRFISVKDFETDPRRIFAVHEITCQVDGSFATKITVNFNLFGGTILKLGTERHHHILKNIDKVDEIGCFALTELMYGNNAVKLETTATYDNKTKEFVINTPNPLAQKYWISNGAIDASWAVVFAQTYVNNSFEGVQAFLVRIRDKDMKPVRGVVIVDMGRKLNQNGVDNARLSFRNVRIPQDMLLNRVADVSAEGKIVSDIKLPRARFIAALNQLMSGRLCLSSKGVGRCKQALAIAVRYSMSRLAVGDSGESDTPIMENGLQQRALIPLIARTFAVSIVGMTYVKDRFAMETTANGKKGLGPLTPETEVLCSGMKALNTWHSERVGTIARERMGGAGYLAANKFEEIIGDAHAICTAEGDNSVLMMKVSKERLAWAKKDPQFISDAMKPFEGFQNLLNSEYLFYVFKKREATMIIQLRGTIARDERMGSTWNDVWQRRQSDLVQSLARSYVERVCLEQFLIEIKKANVKIAVMLEKLAILYALDCLEKDIGYVLTEHVIPFDIGQSLYPIIRDMCAQLTPQALALVESFSVPEHLLPPAAKDWVKYNEVDNQGELKGVSF